MVMDYTRGFQFQKLMAHQQESSAGDEIKMSISIYIYVQHKYIFTIVYGIMIDAMYRRDYKL